MPACSILANWWTWAPILNSHIRKNDGCLDVNHAAGSLSHQRLPSATNGLCDLRNSSHFPMKSMSRCCSNGLNFGHVPNPADNNMLIYPILWLFNTHMENDPSTYIYTHVYMIYYALPFLKIVIFHSKPLKNQSVSFIPRSVALFPLSEALLPLTYLAKIKNI